MSVTTTSRAERTLLEVRNRLDAQDASIQSDGSVRQQQNRSILKRIFTLFPPVLPGALLLLAWYGATAYGHINSLILPSPADVFSSLIDGIRSGLYLEHTLVTVQESLFGFLLAVVLALPLGYGVAKSRLLGYTLQPYLAAGQAVPAIVIAPFLYLWFGIGTLSVIVVCMLVVLFPMVINTILGVQTIERDLLEAARLEGAGGWSMLSRIEFPLALPAILAAVRTGLTLSITGAIVGEFFCNPDHGLGALVHIALNQYNMAFMFATVIVLAVLAALYFGATWFLLKLAEVVY
ncbi:MAG: ABC transporter permease [Ktedonobacteraceae bacterium]